MNVKDILAIVGEVGFVEICKDGAIRITPPRINLHKQRLEIFGRILVEYKKRNPDAIFRGFFTLYDAWREHSEPSVAPDFFKPGRNLLQLFVGKGTLGEPGRFIQPFFMKDYFPVFGYPVLSFGRHKNDPFVQLLPDTDFVASDGYLALRDEIDRCDCQWKSKIQSLYWRGSMHGFPYKTYDQRQLCSQRKLLLNWGKNHQEVSDFSASKNVSKSEQLQYRYLLDVDGEVNAWSGLFWKLYSNSLVFKVNSHYEQWYYSRLRPWEHYIPVTGNLSDLEEKFEWALANDELCCQIARSGRELASSLTLQHEFDQLSLVDESKKLFKEYAVSTVTRYKIPKISTLTVVHTYRTSCETVSQPPGFGDFLRGTAALYQLSMKYGFNLSLDFGSHPLCHYLKHHNFNIETVDLPVYEFFNQKNCELESFLLGHVDKDKICITTHAVPERKVTRQCRQFLMKHLKPTKGLSEYISETMSSLGLDAFCTVHVRMGDDLFNSELSLPPVLEKWFIDDILPVWGTNVLVVSDNLYIKNMLRDRFGIKMTDVKPVHLGQSLLCNATSKEIRDTFAEFLIMSRSSWIYQYSVYPWGSSFSEMCAQIYDIPLERLS